MMTTIRALCSNCGADNESLEPDDLLMLDRVYQYRCPACEQTSRSPLNPRIIAVLTAAGVDTIDDRVRRHASILSDVHTPADIE